MANVLESVKNKAKEAESIIDSNEKNIPKLQKVIDSEFEKADELAKVRKLAEDIDAQLLKENILQQ